LAYSKNYYVTFANGAIKDIAGNNYAGITTYDFTTVASTIIGTSGNNTLNGTSGNDFIYGMGGNDTLSGGLGNDNYFFDTTLLGSGTINDSGGSDTINFNYIANLYTNGYVIELTKSGNSNVNLVTSLMLNGTVINTYTINGQYTGTSLATTAIENLALTEGSMSASYAFIGGLTATANNQFVVGTSSNETLTSDYANNGLWGGDGADTLNASGSNLSLYGGLGFDTFNITSNASSINDLGYGGAEILKVSFGANANAYVYNTGWVATSATVNNGSANIYTNGYTVNLSAISTGNGFYLQNFSATGTTLTGSGLADTIVGGIGNDIITGGVATDRMNGGDGSDIYIINTATEHAAAEITDTSVTGSDEVRFASAIANDTLILYAGDTGIEKVTIGTGTAASAVITDTTALNVDASLVVNALTITGNAGNNVLKSGLGADTLTGGAGNDIYLVDIIAASGALQDTITEAANAGADTVQLRGTSTNVLAATLTLATNLENLDASNTSTSLFNLTGNTANNILTGNAANNILDGSTGTDTLIGGLGNDTYVIDSTTDIITELINGGTDLVQSSVTFSLANIAYLENLTLIGSSAINGTGNTLDNTITGNTGANTLNGGDGNDFLYGGLGNDTLTGGAGVDHFVFNTTLNATSNKDTITDFVSGTDKIDLENAIITGLGPTTGQLTLDQFRSGAGISTAGDSSDRIIHNTTTGGLFYDADGNGSGAAIQFAVIGTNLQITHQDFWIV
jgi:Ca2+-binding RTX toxin-like protein